MIRDDIRLIARNVGNKLSILEASGAGSNRDLSLGKRLKMYVARRADKRRHGETARGCCEFLAVQLGERRDRERNGEDEEKRWRDS